MGSDSCIVKEGFHDRNNDSFFNHVLVSILTKDLSLCMPFATYAKSLRLHFWYCLVGDCSQFDRLFRCLSCKIVFFILILS